jgi:hypothetical protein
MDVCFQVTRRSHLGRATFARGSLVMMRAFLRVRTSPWSASGFKALLIERLERALALFLVVAWRVAHLMRLGRTCPDLDAHLFFDPDEIRARDFRALRWRD